MARSGFWLALLAFTAATATAHAERPVSEAGADLSLDVPQRLELTWPLAPKRMSFSASEYLPPLGAPVQLFEADAVWWESGPLSIRTFGRVQEAFELECRLVCEPVIEQSLGLEARLELGSAGVISEAHLFARSELVVMPQPQSYRFKLGIGGLLDL
jgi:hypothetical protein